MTGLSLSESLLNPLELVESGVVVGAKPSCISTNSIDLCIKDVYEITEGIVLHQDGSRQLPKYHLVSTVTGTLHSDGTPRQYYKFTAGKLYQVEFEERVNLPDNIAALTLMRSSMYKSGASGESGLFDSGYSGSTGMSVSTTFTSYVERGGAIAQMVFLRSSSSKMYNGFYTTDNWMRVIS